MSDFNAFPPAPHHLEIAGAELAITPIRVGEIPKLMAAVKPFQHQISTNTDWFALLSEHGDSLLEAVAIASRQPKAWIEGLELDDAIQLVSTVFEVNSDFFVKRVTPAMTKVAGRIEAMTDGLSAGQRPSTA